MDILRGIIGVLGFLLICYCFSENRKAINWRLVGTGMLLSVVLALLILKVGFIHRVFDFFSSFFVLTLGFTQSGTSFLFGNLVTDPKLGYIFALQALPVIIFFSAITSVLYYLGVLQKVVSFLGRLLQKSMGLSGAESLSASANIFLGQTEAPLVVKPYLKDMNESELLLVMTGGMATIAGSVLVAYVGFLGGGDTEQQLFFATHLMCASLVATPISVVCSKMFIPQTKKIEKKAELFEATKAHNVLDAITEGTTDGLKLAVNVGAMVIVFISFVAMFNYFFESWLGEITGLNGVVEKMTKGQFKGVSLQFLLGFALSPVAWLMGVPTQDVLIVGQLLGEKTILNEFVAYISLGEMKATGQLTNIKSILIATYALSGFANLGSIGIQIGGLGTMAPTQKYHIARIAFKSLLAGSMASFITATVVGTLV